MSRYRYDRRVRIRRLLFPYATRDDKVLILGLLAIGLLAIGGFVLSLLIHWRLV